MYWVPGYPRPYCGPVAIKPRRREKRKRKKKKLREELLSQGNILSSALLCSPGWPGIHYIDQDSLGFTEFCILLLLTLGPSTVVFIQMFKLTLMMRKQSDKFRAYESLWRPCLSFPKVTRVSTGRKVRRYFPQITKLQCSWGWWPIPSILAFRGRSL